MRKWINLAMLIWLTTNSYGQYITADEMLEEAMCRDFDCCNSLAAKKGFSFDHKAGQKPYDLYLFSSDDRLNTSNSKITCKSTLQILQDGKGFANVTFSTPDKRNFTQMLDSFKRLGFEFFYSRDTKNGVNSTYTSRRYPKVILSAVVERASLDNEHWTSYKFELFKT